MFTTNVPLTAIGFGSGRKVTIFQSIPYSAHIQLTPENPYPAPQIVVTSSNATIAVASLVHGDRLSILGLSPGTANITVTAGAFTASLAVTVIAIPAIAPIVYPVKPAIPATAIDLTLSAKTISPLLQFDLGALITPRDFNVSSLAWISSDPSIAEVTDFSYVEHNTGINRLGHVATIRGISSGTATITASIAGVKANCVVTVV